MRGGGGGAGLKMGVPTNGSNGGGHGDHHQQRPSKLMMMREDYHKKILKAKEERMVNMYEENQKKVMTRMMRGGSGEGSGGLMNGNQTVTIDNGGPSVRDFFNERRRMEASGVPVPPIDDHFRQAKGYSSPGGWSSRTGSGNSAKKCSAGRDRSQPLAPIRRPNDTREMARTGNTPRTEKHSNGNMQADTNPFNARPKLVKHKPLPPTNGYSNANGNHYQNQQNHQPHYQNNDTDRNNNDKPHNIGTQSKFGYQGIHQQRNVQQKPPPPQPQQRQIQPPQQQQRQIQPPQQQRHDESQYSTPSKPQQPQTRGGNYGRPRPGGMQSHPNQSPKSNPNTRQQQLQKQQQQQQQQPKMTDFQKWQLEQNKAREDRLKKFNNNNKNDKPTGRWDDNDDEEEDDDGDYDNDRYVDNDEEDDEEDEDDGQSDEVRRLERELLEKIEREKAELERIRIEKSQAEEEERREMEENKKREKMERIKQKKLEEQRRKEEIQRRKEEEEDERRERQREEKERKEEEKRRREDDKRRREEDKLAAKREKEEQKRLEKLQKQQAKESARSRQVPSAYDDYDDYDDERPMVQSSSRRSPPIPTSSRRTLEDVDEMPAVSNATDSSYYAKIAKSSDAKGSVGSLAKCKVCGRSFAVDRLKKHQTACSKANKPRKEFDSSKKRVEGTEAAKYLGKTHKPPPKKKNNWRSQHEEFINSLRYAKKAAQYEKDGRDLRELTPPPTKENPDLVPCPSCGRTFNATAAERHIPRCRDLKTKPPPMKRR